MRLEIIILIFVVFFGGVLIEAWLASSLSKVSAHECIAWGAGFVLVGGLVGTMWVTYGRLIPTPEYLLLGILGQVFMICSTVLGSILISGAWQELRETAKHR